MRASPLIFERFPALRDTIPWLPLAAGAPTPVEPLRAFDLPRLFVKRDDLTSPLYGGNKVRKLEWILADAKRRGRQSVVTMGAWGSHHCLATALFAREAGLRATLCLYPQPPTPHVEEILAADRAAGARVLRARSFATLPIASARAYAASLLAGEGWPYRVAVGGSDARGTLGYVECGLEIAAQVAAGAMPAPDFVYTAAGTCGTMAGLIIGLGLAGLAKTVVVGVGVVPAFIANPRRIVALVVGATLLLEAARPAKLNLPGFEVLDDQLGAGYGLETPASVEARDAALAAGLETETTYTAKALAGLRAFASAPGRRDKVHLYVHTLGHLQEPEPMSLESAYKAVRETAGYWDESGRARIRVTGKDRVKYLQNMLTQDVKALATGDAALACAITVKAKLVAEMRLLVLADAYLIDVDAERAPALLEHLRKFVVINQVVFEEVSATTGALAIEGPEAEARLAAARAVAPAADVAAISISGERGWRIYGERAAIAKALVELGRATGAGPVPGEVVEMLRVENGVPRWGFDLDDNTFPPETGLEATAISATKGCYLGQEPIARLHFLGHVNKHLGGIALAPDEAGLPQHGAKLFTTEGKEVGRVTSTSWSIGLRRLVALAYIRREASAPGTSLRVGAPDDAQSAEVRALPLVAPTAPPPRAVVAPKPASAPGPVVPGGAAEGGMLMPGKKPT